MNMINKKIYYFITVLILFGLFFSFNSCKKPSPTEPQSSSSPSTSGTTSLGTISYSPDHSREKSAELDSTAIDISTTDASGIKWDLHIPKQDFQSNTIITITPITNVKSDTTFNITNGVVFQPDGFMFTNPATLTVTVPQSSNKFVFFTFSQDGKNVELTSFSGSGGSYSIPITHFSGTAAAQVKFFNKLCAIGHEQYNLGLEEENNLLQQPLNAPVPPDIDYGCGLDASKEKLIDDYIKQLETPEDSVIKRMLGGLSTMDLAGCDTNFVGLAQAGKLAERVFNKAQAAYNQYSNDNKKYPAVAKALLTTSAALQLFGGSSPDLFANLGAWAKRYYDAQLTKLRQDHDYSVVNSLLNLSNEAQLFGSQVFFLSDIEQAMTFKLELNEDLNLVYNDGSQGDHIVIQGNVNLQPQFVNGRFILSGTGNINFVSGYTIDDCQDPNGLPQNYYHDEIMLPQSFPLTVYADSLDLCKSNSIVIKFDTLGSTNEQWEFGFDQSGTKTGSHCQNNSGTPLQRTLTDNFIAFDTTRYYNFDTNGFTFRPVVQSGNATVFDKTYNETFNYQYGIGYKLTAKMELKLIHTPQ
jgi:hypothetical protein